MRTTASAAHRNNKSPRDNDIVKGRHTHDSPTFCRSSSSSKDPSAPWRSRHLKRVRKLMLTPSQLPPRWRPTTKSAKRKKRGRLATPCARLDLLLSQRQHHKHQYLLLLLLWMRCLNYISWKSEEKPKPVQNNINYRCFSRVRFLPRVFLSFCRSLILDIE